MGYTDYTWPGKHTKNDGKSPFLMGISTISMAIFHSYLSLPESRFSAKLIRNILPFGYGPVLRGRAGQCVWQTSAGLMNLKS